MNIQLSDYKDFDVSNITFSKPETGNISGNMPKISFKRLRIGAKYADGSQGDLLIPTPANLLSFGLQENTDMATGAVTGYQFPICLWNRNGASPDEKAFTDKFNEIVDCIKNYLVEHRDLIEKYDLELTDLKKFNPMYWKMEKGKIVEGRGPMLYVKVMSSKKTGQILTGMIDDETNTYIDPMNLLNKRCYLTGAIKIESVFIGNKISLQLKLFEAVVRVIDNNQSVRGLLRPDARPRTIFQEEPVSATHDIPTSFEDSVGGGAPNAQEDEEEEYVEEIYEETVEDTVEQTVAPDPPVIEVQPVATTTTTKGKGGRGSTSRAKTATA